MVKLGSARLADMGRAFESLAVLCVALVAFPCGVWGWACRDSCGDLQVKYPFGTGSGCGDPRFVHSVSCVNQRLMFTTHSGSYPITAIDYQHATLYVADPRMSTCNTMQRSGSFGLDWTAPFKIKSDVFVLLNCDATSSVFSSQNYLCDTGSAHICTSLYTCPGMIGLGIPQNAPITSCCVYTPVNLGSANEVDLQKLGCQSYTSIHSFGSDTTDPSTWKYGIRLQYNYNLDNNYFPSACADCERSNGVCGFTGAYNNFVCVCRNGVNTTTNCFGQDYYWGGAQSRRSGSSTLWIIAGFILPLVSIVVLGSEMMRVLQR